MRNIALALTLLAVLGCGQTGQQPAVPGTDPVPTTQETPTTVPTSTTSPPATMPVDWNDPAEVVTLADGWTIQACSGDALLLCVSRDGTQVGTVEALFFPIESFGTIDPDADPASQLKTLAEGFVEAIRSDRAAGCGPDYLFEPIAPRAFQLGSTPGLAYGFVGTMADGRPSELNLQYSAIVGDQIVSIVAIAYDEGGCPGRDELSGFTSVDLAEFRPLLEGVLHASPLPDA